MVPAFDCHIQESVTGGVFESEAKLVYEVSSRVTSSHPVSKNKQTKGNATEKDRKVLNQTTPWSLFEWRRIHNFPMVLLVSFDSYLA